MILLTENVAITYKNINYLRDNLEINLINQRYLLRFAGEWLRPHDNSQQQTHP